MAKIRVIDSDTGAATPFLRGMLTRSLQNAGLSFEEAYQLASQIRQELVSGQEITKRDLRARTLRLLKVSHEEAAQIYRARTLAPAAILVAGSEGSIVPFSRARHSQRLQACGLSSEESSRLTQLLFEHLLSKQETQIGERALVGLTYMCLKRELGPEPARHYLAQHQFRRSGRPLLLLIGGTAGCGKSTVATEAASLLEIVRTQSTDMLREVVRVMIPERLLPVLHRSSFTAWRALPQPGSGPDATEDLLIRGFLQQADLVAAASDAVMQRALREHVSLVIEGVHVWPMLEQTLAEESDAIVVPIVLAVPDQEMLRQRITGRGTGVPTRRAERYLEHFDSIWQLQSFFLAESDRANVAIIANIDKEVAVREVMVTVNDHIAHEFSGDPREVFAKPGDREDRSENRRTRPSAPSEHASVLSGLRFWRSGG